MGTSLTVHPFARLAELVNADCPRVLINLERVGDFAHRPDDVLLLGKCDDMVRKLCQELGWEDELDELWKLTEESVEVEEDALDKEEKAKASAKEEEKDDTEKQSPEDKIEKEVERLTSAVGQSLTISEERVPSPVKITDSLKAVEPSVTPKAKLSADTKEGTRAKATDTEGKL
jgi:NAD-dependent histone deacetylase SIR2